MVVVVGLLVVLRVRVLVPLVRARGVVVFCLACFVGMLVSMLVLVHMGVFVGMRLPVMLVLVGVVVRVFVPVLMPVFLVHNLPPFPIRVYDYRKKLGLLRRDVNAGAAAVPKRNGGLFSSLRLHQNSYLKDSSVR